MEGAGAEAAAVDREPEGGVKSLLAWVRLGLALWRLDAVRFARFVEEARMVASAPGRLHPEP